jgi:hypothetical protein
LTFERNINGLALHTIFPLMSLVFLQMLNHQQAFLPNNQQ